jgi:hypothetical protein
VKTLGFSKEWDRSFVTNKNVVKCPDDEKKKKKSFM